MPRIPRVVGVGYPHHITQRGNYGQTVFKEEEDYIKYLRWLKEYSKKYLTKIWAYCLMSNHIHFVGVPMKEDSFARTFNTLHMRYAQYYNRKRRAKGHLWQGRFYSTVLDERHLYTAIRYVERNPVRVGIVEEPWEYKWSSARAHINKEAHPILSDDCYLIKEINEWRAYLMEREKGAVINNIRENTRTGRVCGKESFIRRIENLLGRKLVALPRGRPHKKK